MLHSRILRYLDEVARCGSIRKAAERLNVAASAINRQILMAEEELGTPIFERLPGGMRLTTTGEIMIAHVRDTLKEHERTLGRIAALRGLIGGEVVIATVSGLASGVMGRVLRDFRQLHPRVRLALRIIPRDAVIKAILDGEADLGLAYNLPTHPRLFRAFEIEQPLGAVLAFDHPLASRKVLRIDDVAPYPIIMATRDMSLREVIDQLVPPDVALSSIVETNSVETMRFFARESPNVGFMTALEADEDIRLGRLAFVPLAGLRAHETMALVHHASGPLDAIASGVVDHLSASFTNIAR